MKLISVVGARPNFMKIAPLCRELKKYPSIKNILVHTGQHYDFKMSQVFFQELEIPRPHINLNAASGSHARQTSDIMIKFEKVLLDIKPSLVVVAGDVNSTLACSVTAAKLLIPVAHIEAGLRSFDRSMPEEINRIVTDSVSDVLFTTCRDANANLLKEGIPIHKIHFTGNIMMDSLLHNLKKAGSSKILSKMGLKNHNYCLVTLHRPANVDNAKNLKSILLALGSVSSLVPVVFPIHPRTIHNINKFGLSKTAAKFPALSLCEPAGYIDFLKLTSCARLVLTDSGGIQEETTALKIPCLTLRDNTERPVTVTMGTNKLISTNPARIVPECVKILQGRPKKSRIPPKWDGKTAERICKILHEFYS
ncbi:MAG: UDP-N-acetylglucosamine 2-epimerase (non-hydrolyzing) [Planctomycetes bacterium]|nr:UDP-N-acetylglucosamine 2-epimerase (non-hydrolyzing) [Planctomycetota bacterium]